MPQVAQGGTLRLRAEYKDSTGALTDPTTPLVDILNPAGGLVVTGAVPTRQSLGYFYYDRVAGGSDTLGDWTVRWTGVIDGGTQEAEESFTVVTPGSLTPSDPAMLVTLAAYKSAIRETSSANDGYHEAAILAASRAILSYSDRDFGAANVTEARTYIYDGHGVLNIDECTAVASVAFTGVPLITSSWVPRVDGPSGVPYSWLELPVIDWGKGAQSLGAMGFEQNFDQFLQRGYFPELRVTVTADWGWPAVPADVQRATIWTAKSYEDIEHSGGEGGDLSSKTVAEVTESYFQAQLAQAGQKDPPALPDRAKAIIDAYRRISL